jgi:CheY-like chemotaxis protein
MRILFVDDEPRVLDGLHRMLRSRRREWDLHFALSGDEALERLAALPFDVIVSDMRMPRMDGAALLTIVRETFPDVIRIVLTGHTELERALQIAPVAHQFLTKPCDPLTLQSAIDHARSRPDRAAGEAFHPDLDEGRDVMGC